MEGYNIYSVILYNSYDDSGEILVRLTPEEYLHIEASK